MSINRISLKIIAIVIVFILLFPLFSYAITDQNSTNSQPLPNEINEEKNNSETKLPTQEENKNTHLLQVQTQYEYDKNTNTVKGKMIANLPLKNTKVSWQLSEDKLTYTTTLKSNGSYTTTVESVDGQIAEVLIEVTQIDETGPAITMEYIYHEDTNTVTGIMHANEKLKPTKVSWQLSEDRLTYTTTLKSNGSYTTTVEDIWGNQTQVFINVTQIDEQGPKITMEYIYHEDTNTVTGIMHSNEPLKPTKVSWQLSEDRLTYTTTLKSNGSYTTTVEDIHGNQTQVVINVTQIDETPPIITMEYIYHEDTNTVTGIMHANERLKPTKVSWQLSEDGLTYTTTLRSNGSYMTTVEDLYGHQTQVLIEVTHIDEEAPVIQIDYSFTEDDRVTVVLTANERMKNTKPTWALSQDGKQYTKTFDADTEYATPVEDIHGNETWVKIRIVTKKYTYTNSVGPNINVRYLYDTSEKVTVQIVSDRKLQDTKPTWQLSQDKKIYTKTFTQNDNYITNVIDEKGNQVEVSILVNFFSNTKKGIDVSEYQKMINWSSVKRSGIDFAMIRVGYRGWGASGTLVEDRFFKDNIQEATKAGLDIGFYFFTQAITVEEAKQEAKYVIDLLAKYHVPIKYPIAIDTERTPVGTGRADSLSKQARTDICLAFCETIEQAGYKSMIYANKDWLLNDLQTQRLSKKDIWLAHYAKQTDYPYPYQMWQYTSSGTVNGIVGNVDLNIGYQSY